MIKLQLNSKDCCKGFTLPELLLALSICVVVTTIVIIGVATVRANMNRLTASESAKEIYIAAENKLLELKETSQWESFIDNNEFVGEHILNVASDFDYWTEISGFDKGDITDYTWGDDGNMYVLSSFDSKESNFIENIMLPAGSIDDSIIDNANYYIELNIKTATVYGVYYCLGNAKYNDICDHREKEFSVNDETVGYYGGGILSENIVEPIVDPHIELINGEELSIEVSLDKSLETNLCIEIEGLNSEKTATLNIETNYTYLYDGEKHSIAGGETSDMISYEVILDSLTRYDGENKHFSSLFSSFYPGENIMITVYVRPSNDYISLPVIRKFETNSLFDNIDDSIGISSIRHLENLDKRISNLDEKVEIGTKAELLSNVSFSGYGEGVNEDSIKNYLESELICTYDDKEKEIFNPNGKSFFPINLSNVNVLEGNGYKIYDISINLENYENVGIIGKCSKITVNNIGLVGSYEREFLKYPSLGAVSSTTINAGAFIGSCESAKINKCYSTTKINIESGDDTEKTCVGGFVGKSALYIEIKNSYGGGIVNSNGIYEDSIKVKISENNEGATYLGGFVGLIESEDLAEAFIYKSYQTQSLSILGATNSKSWIYEGGFIGGMRFDDANIDIDSNSYIAAPIKSDIISVTLDEIVDYKNNGGDKRNIRFGGIIGGFQDSNGTAYNKDPKIDFVVDAKYVNYFADFCGVSELLSNNKKDYSNLIKLKEAGLYYRNNYGTSVDIGNLISNKISQRYTFPISDYLSGKGYSFSDPTGLGHHYGDWQVKEYGSEIKIDAGHGISSVDYGVYNFDGNSAIVNYGEEIDMSLFKATNEEGYEGKKYELVPKTDGSSGILIENNGKYTYIAGVNSCEFLCTATSIKAPNFEINGGGEFVYNYEDVLLQIVNNQKYANNISLNYEIYEDENVVKEDGSQVNANEVFSTNYTVLKNNFRGTRYYVISGKVSDGILESKESSSTSREVILNRVKVIFNKNDVGSAPHGVTISPSTFGYVEYGSSDIFKDEYSMETITPTAKRTSYEFLGWSTPLGTAYKPTKLNDITVYAQWKKIRHKVYTYSGGGWFYD